MKKFPSLDGLVFELDPSLEKALDVFSITSPGVKRDESSSPHFVWIASEVGLENFLIAHSLHRRWIQTVDRRGEGARFFKAEKAQLLSLDEKEWKVFEGSTLFLELLEPLWKEQQIVLVKKAKQFQIHLIVACLFSNASLDLDPAFQVWKFPPLRERSERIPSLVNQFVQPILQAYPELSWVDSQPSVQQKLCQYPWPGNTWELFLFVQKTLLHQLSQRRKLLFLREEELLFEGGGLSDTAFPSLKDLSFHESYTSLKKKWSLQFEKKYLIQILTQYCGNVSAASRDCKIDRSNFLRLLRRHQLKAESFRPEKTKIHLEEASVSEAA